MIGDGLLAHFPPGFQYGAPPIGWGRNNPALVLVSAPTQTRLAIQKLLNGFLHLLPESAAFLFALRQVFLSTFSHTNRRVLAEHCHEGAGAQLNVIVGDHNLGFLVFDVDCRNHFLEFPPIDGRVAGSILV